MSINLLKRTSRLPAEYQEVEYIESTGTQYINTGVNIATTDNITLTLEPRVSVGDKVFWGAYNSDSECCEVAMFSQSTYNKFRFNLQLPDTLTNNPAVVYGDKYTFVFDNGKWKYQDVYYGVTQADNLTAPAYIFARNRIDQHSVDKYAQMRLYSCQIERGGSLIRNFVPCYRKSDNVIGLYDLVNNAFYTNAGTGTFLKGADIDGAITIERVKAHLINTSNGGSINKVKAYLLSGGSNLPSEYQEVEYIESTGTQYMRPPLTVENDTKFVISYSISAYGGHVASTYGGSAWNLGSATSDYYAEMFGYRVANDIITQSLNERITVEAQFKSGDSYIKYNNEVIYTDSNDASVSSTYDMGLFARYRGYTDNRSQIKLYSLQRYKQGVLTLNLVPCYRVSDGVIGLYDTVSETFFTNAGTGTFSKGSDVVSYNTIKI